MNIEKKMVDFLPFQENGVTNIIQDNGIDFNITGFIAFCITFEHDIVTLLTEKGIILGKVQGVNFVYEIEPKFIYGDVVKSTNGTSVQGTIKELFYHGNDNEFKYFIKDNITGKKLKRRYNPDDLEKVANVPE